HRVGACRVERPVGFIGELEEGQGRAALEQERRVEPRLLRRDYADGTRRKLRCVHSWGQRSPKNKNPFSFARERVSGPVSLAVFIARPQAELQIGASSEAGSYPAPRWLSTRAVAAMLIRAGCRLPS